MRRFASVCFMMTAFALAAQVGSDGNVTVAAANTVVNSYSALTVNVSAGGNTLTVANAAALGLAPNKLIMVIQMQGAGVNNANSAQFGMVTAFNNAGVYELAAVQSVAGNTLNLDVIGCGGLRHGYTAAGHAQVIRVPEYNNLTVSGAGSIVAPAWNGATGGVIAVHVAGTLTVNGIVDVSGRGFRGGVLDNNSNTPVSSSYTYRSTDSFEGAEKGEGAAGYQADYDAAAVGGRYSLGAPANGGGGGAAHNGGGGGGGNGNNAQPYTGAGVMSGAVTGATAWTLDPDYIANGSALTNSSGGGRGGYSYSANNGNALSQGPGNAFWSGDNRQYRGGKGGRPLSNDPVSRLFMGGGGGSGDANNSVGGAGGAGGGIVLVMTDVVNGFGFIRANGAAGGASTGNDGAGGAGAGGTLVVKANGLSNVILGASGGAGGNQAIGLTEAEGTGGGGGGGYIASSGGTVTRLVTGGAGGTTDSTGVNEFPSNGATNGAAGQTATISAALPLCLTTDLAISMNDGQTLVVPGTAVAYAITVSNLGLNLATGAMVGDPFPAGVSSGTWSCAGANCPAATGSAPLSAAVTLPAGASITFTLTLNIPAVFTGNLVNTATIAVPAGWADSVPGNNFATDIDALDSDGDNTADSADCAPLDPTAWAQPGPAQTLTLAASKIDLNWLPPAILGGTTVFYEVWRSPDPSQPGAALATGLSPTTYQDPEFPSAPGSAFFYNIRSGNACGTTP